MNDSDERLRTISAQLQGIRDGIAICAFCLITLTIMAAGVAVKTYGWFGLGAP